VVRARNHSHLLKLTFTLHQRFLWLCMYLQGEESCVGAKACSRLVSGSIAKGACLGAAAVSEISEFSTALPPILFLVSLGSQTLCCGNI
jgi:hypothetical protein